MLFEYDEVEIAIMTFECHFSIEVQAILKGVEEISANKVRDVSISYSLIWQ